MSAKYTVELRTLMNNEDVKPLLKLALSTYPLYSSVKSIDLIPTREELNRKLLNHYKYREIGFETVGRFLDELEITMCEIMPYYNQRFKTIEIMHDLPNPFDNVDFIEEYTEERTGQNEKETTGSASSSGETNSTDSGTSETNSSNTAHSETTASDESNTTATVNHNNKTVHTTTPSDTVSIPAQNIDSVTHADEVTWNKDTNSDTGTTQGSSSSETDTTNTGASESNSSNTAHSETTTTAENEINEAGSHSETIHHTFTKKGNQGVNTYAHDMNEYRTALIDVVEEIITDTRVSDLFMKVY